MLKNQKALLLLLPLLVLGFGFGLFKLFQLRFERGDVYPPSSSLRADPLGAKIFHDSLREMHSVEVARLYDPLNKIDSGRDKTLFVLGSEIDTLNWVSARKADEIEKFLFEGGRIVISFQPVSSKSWNIRRKEKRDEAEQDEEKKVEESNRTEKKSPIEEEEEDEVVSLLKKWNLKPLFDDLETDDEGVAIPVTVTRSSDAPALPDTLPWHTALCFDTLSENWQQIYFRDTNAVVLERFFGSGSLVLCSDSYLFSNEAMHKERQPALLAWFVGGNRSILFDETHLGVQSKPGIASLARKYRLHGLIAGLLLLGGLLVWKNTSPLVPPHDEEILEDRQAVVVGREASAGFVNLLRRSIAPQNLLNTCFEEWKKSFARQRRSEIKLHTIESLLHEQQSKPAHERSPVKTYQTISAILTERK